MGKMGMLEKPYLNTVKCLSVSHIHLCTYSNTFKREATIGSPVLNVTQLRLLALRSGAKALLRDTHTVHTNTNSRIQVRTRTSCKQSATNTYTRWPLHDSPEQFFNGRVFGQAYPGVVNWNSLFTSVPLGKNTSM